MIRYVIFSKQAGIFLDEVFGLGFWSRRDAAGMSNAITFSDAEKAKDYVETWGGNPPSDWQPWPIDCIGQYATMQECVKAGLPAWDPMENNHVFSSD